MGQYNRSFGVLRGILAGLLIVRATLAQPPADAPAKSSPSEWSRNGPSIHLGRRDVDHPPYTSVEAPVNAVAAAQEFLGGTPEDWEVNNMQDYAQEGRHGKPLSNVVVLHWKEKSFVCLIQSDRWIRLNSSESLTYLNEVVEPLLTSPDDLRDPNTLAWFADHAIDLYTGWWPISFHVVNRLDDGELADELNGRVKNPKVLRDSIPAPTVKQRDGSWVIEYNALSHLGSVEKYTLTIKVADRVSITGVTVERVHPPGAFSYPSFY